MTYSRLATELAERDLYGVFRESDPIRTYPGGAVGRLGRRLRQRRRQGPGRRGAEAEPRSSPASRARRCYESSPSGGRIPLGTSTVTPAQNGLNDQLTIDSELQWMAERRLAKQVARRKADFGFAITMNVKTGEVLALAQAPTVDSSAPGRHEARAPRRPGRQRPVRAGQRAEAPHLRGPDRLRAPPTRTPG